MDNGQHQTLTIMPGPVGNVSLARQRGHDAVILCGVTRVEETQLFRCEVVQQEGALDAPPLDEGLESLRGR